MRRVSTVAFRRLCTERGAALAYSECIRASRLLAAARKGNPAKYFDRSPEEHPLGVQLSVTDPISGAEAARHVLGFGYDLIDLNFGCPQVERPEGPEGAELMRDPARIGRIVEGVVKAAGGVPVTVKLRAGADRSHRNALEVARIVENAGADAVTVHGRTGTDGYLGTADWSVIANVKQSVRIPVVGNGDVVDVRDVARMIEQTGCDFVMVGRGSFGNPWLFERANVFLRTGIEPPEPSFEARLRTRIRYLELAHEHGDWPHGVIDAAYRFSALEIRRGNEEWGRRASPLERSLWGRALLGARRTWKAARGA